MINIELKGGGERIVRSLRLIYISCVKAVNMDISIFLLILQLYYVICEDEIPDHHFVKKLQDGKKTVIVDGQKEHIIVKKVFITLHKGAYKYRKKRFIGVRGSNNFRAQFICNEFGKLGHLLEQSLALSVTLKMKQTTSIYSYNIPTLMHMYAYPVAWTDTSTDSGNDNCIFCSYYHSTLATLLQQ